jgi:hypothetical protein
VEPKKYSFDRLQMFFGEDYQVAEGIVISQPTIGEIMIFGEDNFNQVLNPFVVNPTSLRVALWQQGKDWTEMSDYELFYQLILQLQLTPKETSMIFGDLDFSKFNLYKRQNEVNGELVEDIVLLNHEQKVLIDEEIYNHMSSYLRTMFNIFPKVEKAKGKTTKEWMIEGDIMNSKSQTERKSNLLSMISFCLNHPGFKYKKSELKELGVVEFYDSVQRLLIYESTSSLMKGIYSGFVDTSKIDKKEFDFMRGFDS